MKCERCGEKHDGSYGSGRFCSSLCSHKRICSKVTKNKIRKKIKQQWNSGRKDKITDKHYKFTPEVQRKIYLKKEAKRQQLYKEGKFDKISEGWLRKKVLEEQKEKCVGCGNKKWLGKPIILELHHKDGNRKNKNRDNLEFLCLNCHATTKNFRFNGRKHKKE